MKSTGFTRRFEVLEDRYAATAGPQVVGLLLASTGWTSSFYNYLQASGLGTGGYSVPVGSNSQLSALPWTNLNQIKIVFNQNVLVDAADLCLTGVNVFQYSFAAFSYDASTYTATWTLASAIGPDRLLIDLDGNGIDPVRNLAGAVLDGEWTDGSSVFVSGNGVAGGDFQFRLNVLPGDVNQSGSVLGNDTVLVQNAQFLTTTSGGYSPFLDVNGSGSILSNDTLLVQQRQFSTLPSGTPAGWSNDAPSAGRIPDLNVYENAVDSVIPLLDYFQDLETPGSGLSFQITQNTNPSLFTSTNINPATQRLTIDFAAYAVGSSTLTVTATDSGGLSVNTSFNVTVQANNQAPQIIDFIGQLSGAGRWNFTGKVLDESPANRPITFGGLLAGYSTTSQANGAFAFSSQLSAGVVGDVTAVTTDIQGLTSNTAVFTIDLT